MALDPMYAALNTPDYRGSIFKAYAQYKAALESKQKYQEILHQEVKRIQQREEKERRGRRGAGNRQRNGRPNNGHRHARRGGGSTDDDDDDESSSESDSSNEYSVSPKRSANTVAALS